MPKICTVSTIEEISNIVNEAAQLKNTISVYRKADTDIKLDLSHFNKIAEIDTANLVATVEAGVTFGQLKDVLRKEHLVFVPADTPFYQNKTIGGFFYEGCSNITSLKYGFAKHFIMGADYLLPNGEILKAGGKTVKNVTGYDMTRFMGSPYMNCCITLTFLLKLLPKPEIKKQLLLKAANTEQLFVFIDNMRQEKILPSFLIWADKNTQKILQLADTDNELIYLEMDGIKKEFEEDWQKMAEITKNLGLKAVTPEEFSSDDLDKIIDLYEGKNVFTLTDELKFLYTDEKQFVKNFYTRKDANTAVGLFGQPAEGKINLCFANKESCSEEIVANITHYAQSCNGFIAGKWQRVVGKIPDGPLQKVEENLKNLFDPLGILQG